MLKVVACRGVCRPGAWSVADCGGTGACRHPVSARSMRGWDVFPSVCLWHKADVPLLLTNVRFWGQSGRDSNGSLCRLMTQSGHMPGGLPRAGPSLITAEESFQGTNRTTLEMWKLVGLSCPIEHSGCRIGPRRKGRQLVHEGEKGGITCEIYCSGAPHFACSLCQAL